MAMAEHTAAVGRVNLDCLGDRRQPKGRPGKEVAGNRLQVAIAQAAVRLKGEKPLHWRREAASLPTFQSSSLSRRARIVHWRPSLAETARRRCGDKKPPVEVWHRALGISDGRWRKSGNRGKVAEICEMREATCWKNRGKLTRLSAVWADCASCGERKLGRLVGIEPTTS